MRPRNDIRNRLPDVALATRFDLRVTSTLTNPLDLETPSSALTYSNSLTDLATGTGLGQADLKWSDHADPGRVGHRGPRPGGCPGRVRSVPRWPSLGSSTLYWSRRQSANTNDVQISPAASNGIPLFWPRRVSLIPVKPGGLVELWAAPTAAGVVVTPTTGRH
jgi:hypothetical protein